MSRRLAALGLLAAVTAGAQPPRASARAPADTALRRGRPAVTVPPPTGTAVYTLRRLRIDSAGRWTLRQFDACVPGDVARNPAGRVPLCERTRGRW